MLTELEVEVCNVGLVTDPALWPAAPGHWCSVTRDGPSLTATLTSFVGESGNHFCFQNGLRFCRE